MNVKANIASLHDQLMALVDDDPEITRDEVNVKLVHDGKTLLTSNGYFGMDELISDMYYLASAWEVSPGDIIFTAERN